MAAPVNVVAMSDTPRIYPILNGPSIEDIGTACDELYPEVDRVYTMEERAAILRRAYEIMRARETLH